MTINVIEKWWNNIIKIKGNIRENQCLLTENDTFIRVLMKKPRV